MLAYLELFGCEDVPPDEEWGYYWLEKYMANPKRNPDFPTELEKKYFPLIEEKLYGTK